jgi:acetyl esterase/lipase
MNMQRVMAAGLIISAGMVGSSYAQAPTAATPGAAPPPPPFSSAPSSVQPKATYPNKVEGLFDITYETVPGFRPLKLDLYHLTGTQTARPAVIFLHGGGFRAGSPRAVSAVFGEMDQVLARLAARGYVVVGATYRLSGEVRFPGPVEDVKAAVRWLRANAAKYGVDTKRIALWGESAGAYYAVLVGTSCKAEALEGNGGNADQSSCVQAVVDWFGPTDMSQMDAQAAPGTRFKHGGADSPESKLLGCALSECPKELLQEANPLTYITAGTPPFLIMHGDIDTTVPLQQSQMLKDALRAKGVAATLIVVPQVSHVFAGATAAQGQTILDQVFHFLDTTFGT